MLEAKEPIAGLEIAGRWADVRDPEVLQALKDEDRSLLFPAMPEVLPIEVRGLVKHYGEFTAVNGIDLDVGAGECVALLGPNGAGKTTTIRTGSSECSDKT